MHLERTGERKREREREGERLSLVLLLVIALAHLFFRPSEPYATPVRFPPAFNSSSILFLTSFLERCFNLNLFLFCTSKAPCSLVIA